MFWIAILAIIAVIIVIILFVLRRIFGNAQDGTDLEGDASPVPIDDPPPLPPPPPAPMRREFLPNAEPPKAREIVTRSVRNPQDERHERERFQRPPTPVHYRPPTPIHQRPPTPIGNPNPVSTVPPNSPDTPSSYRHPNRDPVTPVSGLQRPPTPVYNRPPVTGTVPIPAYNVPVNPIATEVVNNDSQHDKLFVKYNELSVREKEDVVDLHRLVVDVSRSVLDSKTAMIGATGDGKPLEYVIIRIDKRDDKQLSASEKEMRRSFKIKHHQSNLCRFARLRIENLNSEFYRLYFTDYTPYIEPNAPKFNALQQVISRERCHWEDIKVNIFHNTRPTNIRQAQVLVPTKST